MNFKFHEKTTLYMMLLLSLTTCSFRDEDQASHDDKTAVFKAVIGEEKYAVPIKCYDFDSDKFDTNFLFVSLVPYKLSDTNGDGIRVKGSRIRRDKDGEFFALDGISLDLVFLGISYETTQGRMPEKSRWTKTELRILGSDIVYMSDEGGFYTESYPISYEIICK